MLPNYSIASEAQLIKEHFSVEIPEGHKGTYNAQPTDLLPVITSADPDMLNYYHWGITPSFTKSKGVSHKLLFAPVEDILNKASQRKSLKQQRCIIPADSFYYWKDLGKKEQVPYRFYLSNNSLFSIAGIWDSFENEEGEQVNTFMMLTTKANSDINDVSERMPALLNDDLLVEWLNDSNTAESILEYVVPFNDEAIKSYTINPKLADPQFNNADLWQKVPPANQFGNLTLFN
ncbi:SOS response-associated peptidase [Roseivirga sp.]|uniref:SOS response-associated peptidase n=1 Tax=Roseivirga sp. TaxID=1964215 RepID=UPI003B521169